MTDVQRNAGKPLDSISVALARVFWMFLGPVALGLTVIQIIIKGTGWTTGLDLFFFLVLALMIGCRWYELHSGQGLDAYGRPPAADRLRRYTIRIIPTLIIAWAIANVVGNHLLSRNT